MISNSTVEVPKIQFRLPAMFITSVLAVLALVAIAAVQRVVYRTPHQLALESVNGRDGWAREEADGFVVADLNGGGIPVRDQALQDLVECQRLKKITAYQTLISDEGLKFLHVHKDLRTLHLDGCVGITDKSIPELLKLQQLGELSLVGTSITETGLNTLRKALPNCRINQSSQARAEGDAIPPVEEPLKAHGACDFHGFLESVKQVQAHREERLLSAQQFADFSKDKNTIVLDARGESDFVVLHVKGSKNLPYTSLGLKSLRELIPDTETRILIYCRNNLANAAVKDLVPFIEKSPAGGLNIPTAVTLYSYGYKNVWELGEIVDPDHGPIEFVRQSSKD